MAKSIKLGADTYLDASGVTMKSSSSATRKTLEDWGSGILDTKMWAFSGGTSLTFNIDNGSRVFVLLASAGIPCNGIYAIARTNAGSTYVIPLVAASDVTITPSTTTNEVTIASTTSTVHCLFIVINGAISRP